MPDSASIDAQIVSSTTATWGLRKRGCTSAALRKNRPRAAIAYITRDPLRMTAAFAPRVDTITVSAIIVAPHGPTSAVAARSATRVVPRSWFMGSAYR